MALSTALAKALFDNTAESPEELAFRKGDILMVLDHEGGGPGWWLCSLHGRQGIAPANRLRLLNTSQSCPGAAGELIPPSSTVIQPQSEDMVYLSPGPHPRPVVGPADSGEGVYLAPSPRGAMVVSALCRGDGRPRSRSSCGSRPRPDWEPCTPGRARSPSLQGRATESGTALYQTPTAHRLQGGAAPEALYLSPCGMPRVAAESLAPEVGGAEATYLVPREAVAVVDNSEVCHLVPRVGAQASEEVYQTPTGGAVVDSVQDGLARGGMGQVTFSSETPPTPKTKLVQEAAGFYQTPTLLVGLPKAAQRDHKILGENVPPASCLGPRKHISCPTEGSPRNLSKIPGNQSIPSTPPSARGRLTQAQLRNSPILARAGNVRVHGSPNFSRKPTPPAPPVRGVTKKDSPAQQEGQKDRQEEKNTKKNLKMKPSHEEGEYEEPDDDNLRNQVYDTPPTSKWQHAVQPVCPENDDNIYSTPRTLPPHGDQVSEVYDVPTLTLAKTPDLQQQTRNVPASFAGDAEAEDDVYSVPTLPGVSAALADVPNSAGLDADEREVYHVPGPEKQGPVDQTDGAPCPEGAGERLDHECGIYDMPALSIDAPLLSARRSSVSSTGSGDLQWKSTLNNLIQSTLSSTSSSLTSRDLTASLTEILSVWKAGQAAEAPPPLLQAWSRISDLLPALSACGSAPPTESLLSLVQRTLDDSALLLQSQGLLPSGWPCLVSQESLSRRPLPALPVAEVKPLNLGMGSRKGSWIQERPLPPPPPPSFPLPPVLPPQINNGGQVEGEEAGNEYAGIGVTAAPPTLPVGDSGGYVKLQGKPDSPAVIQTENNPATSDTPAAELRLSPSPPLPVTLSLEDSELLSFYASQSLAHLSCLADSIDALFNSVQGNQPPRVFVSRGKSLIVTAHKLVFIGDTLSRLLTSPDLRTKVSSDSSRRGRASVVHQKRV
ncbi:embryonal Fyn-associated substrate-like [Arapaima gigas]